MIGRALLLGLTLMLSLQVGGVPKEEGTSAPPAAPTMSPEDSAWSWGWLAAERLRKTDVRELEIVADPISVPVIPRTPEMLEKHPEYRISVNYFFASRWKDDLISVLETSHGWMAEGTSDYVWGCIAYDSKRNRVLEMYFDRPGAHAVINGVPLTVDTKVVELLERRCSPLWK